MQQLLKKRKFIRSTSSIDESQAEEDNEFEDQEEQEEPLRKKKKIQTSRDDLLNEIRSRLLKNPNTPILKEDILDEDVRNATISELNMIILNMNHIEKTKNLGIYGKIGVDSIANSVSFMTDNSVSLEDAKQDNELIADVDDFLYSYMGFCPSLLKIMIRLYKHLQFKEVPSKTPPTKKTNATTID